ncbi:MAG: DUF1559 domain-containing protein [Gemmataceae bacterium]|nr:DUF1559 domain-containing protein [Gemmataceae bacterium]
MAGEFKQQCPSCEAMVSIKDETLVGKKTECTKCKFRFLVEAPSKGKPADDKKAPPVKSKAAGKEAAAKAKQEIKKAESGQKGPKKAGAKNKQMLIIGGAVGGVALVAIIAAMFLFSGGEDNSKTKVADKGKRNRSGPVTPNGPNDKPEETPEEKPKEEEKAPVVAKSDGVDPDVSIRVPGDTKVLVFIQINNFLNSIFSKPLFNTPGAFNQKDFAKTFGVSIEQIEQIMLARSSMLPDFNPLKKSWRMAILRSKEPFKKAHIEKSISLTQELPIEGLLWSKIAGQLDSLSSLILGFESNEKLSFFLADSRTIVIASEEKMNDYLKKDRGKPKKVAMAAPPPEAPKPVDPNNPMPPMPPGSPMPMPPGSPMPMPPGSPMPNGQQPVDPNNPMPVVSDNRPSVINHFETLPLSFAKELHGTVAGIPYSNAVMVIGVDLGELAAVIPIASGFLSTFKTPGGAPIPPDIVNQIKNLSKLEYALLSVNKSDLDEQGFALIAVSRDRKVASDFVKLAFPLVKNIPLALKESKLDISAVTEDSTGGDASAAPNPNTPPPVSAGAEEKPGAHGFVMAVARYDPIKSNMNMGIGGRLTLPPAMLKSFEGSFGEYLVTLKNSFETKVVGKSADPISKAIMGYVNDKKAFPRGTAEEATNNKKFGLKMAPDKRVGWIVELLPYFSNGDYASFAKSVDRSKSWSDPKNHQVARMFIPDLLFATPVEGTSVSSDANQSGITNFVGVSGVGYASGEYSTDNKKSGVFGYDRITKIEDIKDGPANTIALLLIKQNKNHPWIAGGGASIAGISEGPDALAPFLILEKTNRNKEKEFTGIAIMADGKIREISNKISPEIFRAMCTIDGGEKIDNLDAIAPIVK